MDQEGTAKLYCDCHLKNSDRIKKLEKAMDKSDGCHGDMWNAIRGRLATPLFIGFVSIYVLVTLSSLGFSLAIYDSIKNVELKVAVIEKAVELHMAKTGSEINLNNGR